MGRYRCVPWGCERADLWCLTPEVAGASCDNLVFWENGVYPECPRGHANVLKEWHSDPGCSSMVAYLNAVQSSGHPV